MSESTKEVESREKKTICITRIMKIQEQLRELSYPSKTYDSCQDYVKLIGGYYVESSGDTENKSFAMEWAFPKYMGYLMGANDEMLDIFLEEMEKRVTLK